MEAFFGFAEQLCDGLCGNEILFANLARESSDFVRLNQNRVRQAGHVRALALTLTLSGGAKQVEGSCDLSGDPDQDLARARTLLAGLRARLAHVPEDPYLNLSLQPTRSERRASACAPASHSAVETLIAAADGLDLVGIWASGEMADGLASSLGHRHWHESVSFHLDWSLYLEGDKAVKGVYSGFRWEPDCLRRRLATLTDGLRAMARPAKTLEPGRYRAYLAPSAVQELMDMLAWGGFDLKSHRTHQTPLLRMVRGERAFDPRISIREEHKRGLVPTFTPEGFLLPPHVDLITAGQLAGCLVDARTAREFGAAVNASSGAPASLALAPGALEECDILARLGTGLWIGHLWYCNWSDPNDCRVTGMTRFGTYWVENGEIVAPVKVMRFDDSLYHLLGDRLEDLTAARELLMSPQTYDGRSSDSAVLPGILVAGIDLTL
nr:metallopeptidase TldD-related protein [Thiocapsa imhoffii]